MEINEFINLLLSKKPNQRCCNVFKLRTHNFFKKFNWDDLLDFMVKAPYVPESWDWSKNKANVSEPFEMYLNVRHIKINFI